MENERLVDRDVASKGNGGWHKGEEIWKGGEVGCKGKTCSF
jgi:hypothetical protein